MISGLGLGDTEAEQISELARKYHRPDRNYQTGDLRDIYPMNIPSSLHLDREVLGMRFEDWVSNQAHGKLELLDENLFAWCVDEKDIPEVREVLKPTGMMLCI